MEKTPEPQEPKRITAAELLQELTPRLHAAVTETMIKLEIDFSTSAHNVIEAGLTGHAVKSAILAGLSKEQYFTRAGLAWDASFKQAVELGIRLTPEAEEKLRAEQQEALSKG